MKDLFCVYSILHFKVLTVKKNLNKYHLKKLNSPIIFNVLFDT